MTEIPPVFFVIPTGMRCQGASQFSFANYIPCNRPAVAIVYHKKDNRSYYMCEMCADHNVRNRGGALIYQKEKISGKART